jgi:intein/homing endonuclease
MNRDFDIPFIEDPRDLNIDVKTLKFNRIKRKEIKTVENHKVYDLEIDKLPNYHTLNGIVHNGGGKL